MDDYISVLRNANRLAVLRELALLDDKRETIFDRFTEFAGRVLGTPYTSLNMISDQHEIVKSFVTSYEEEEDVDRYPVEAAPCKHVIGSGQPLIVNDVRIHDLLREDVAIAESGVIGYLGMPLQTKGHNIGTFCTVDDAPRQWSDTEIAIMREMATILNHEIDLRAQAQAFGQLERYLNTGDNKYADLFDAVPQGTPQVDALRIIAEYRARLITSVV